MSEMTTIPESLPVPCFPESTTARVVCECAFQPATVDPGALLVMALALIGVGAFGYGLGRVRRLREKLRRREP